MRTIHTLTGVLLLTTALMTGCGSGQPSAPEQDSAIKPADLTAAPAALKWDNYRGMRLPRSPADGPKQVGEVAASGYSRSPQGAVLAAMRGQAYLALAGDTEWGRVVATLTAPGPGRDEFAAYRTPLSISGALPSGSARFVGFKVIGYHADPLTAGVHVAEEIGTPPRLFAWPVALQWLQGDWRIVLPTTAEGIDAIELSNLDGYTRLEDR